MRHSLTSESVLKSDSPDVLLNLHVCKDCGSWRPPGEISGPVGLLKMWQAPNLLVFGRGQHPPICGQSDGRDDEPDDTSGDSDTKKPSEGATTEGSIGKKQVLRGFSSKSSLSISRLLSSIDWKKNGQCVHVTLTYHHIWPRTKAEIQREKQALVQFLQRLGVCGIWKLEYQTRESPSERSERLKAGLPRHTGTGSLLVPHWHLLLWIGQQSYDAFCDRLITWWQKRAQNASKYAVDVRPGDVGKASFYLCLHSAKASQSPNIEVGRWWGYVDRARVIESVDVGFVGLISERERIWWYRLYRRYRRIRATPMGSKGFGFSWFLPRRAQQELSCWIRDKVERELYQQRNLNPF